MYNTKVFAEKGWAPPTSWNDLKDPKYQKLLVIPPINNTYGLHTLLMLAKMNGGGEKPMSSPASRSSRSRVNPNVLAYEPSPGKMTELFQSGQAVLAVWGTGRVQTLRQHRLPRRLRLSEGRRGHAADDGLPDRQAQRLAARIELRQGDARAEDPARAAEGLRLRPGAEDRSWSRRSSARWRRSASAPQNSIIAGLGCHQREARGMDQALESRGRALRLRAQCGSRTRSHHRLH